jgi:hypothetical protein
MTTKMYAGPALVPWAPYRLTWACDDCGARHDERPEYGACADCGGSTAPLLVLVGRGSAP